MRAVAFIILLLSVLNAAAWERVDSQSSMVDVHLRVEVREGSRFGIRLAEGDTSSWREIAVRIPNAGPDELDNRIYVKLEFLTCTKDGKSVRDSALTVPIFASDVRFPAMSVKLVHYDGFGHMELGERRCDFKCPFPVDSEKELFIDFYNDKRTKVIRRTLRSELLPRLEYSRFASVDEALAYVRASADPMERVWNYYDTTKLPFGVSVPTGYRLVSVAAPYGYDLVLIASDSRIARVKPLMIKGKMMYTDFEGIYNLDWRDSQGASQCRDASAKVENNMLTLFFPFWDVSIRFSTPATK